MTHQISLQHSGTQRNHKDFHLMRHQMPFWHGIRCKTVLENYGCGCVCRAALKGTNLKGTNANLQFSAGSCGFLWFSVVSYENQRFFCEKLRFRNALFSRKKGENQRKSAKICAWARFVPLGSAPYARPEKLWAVPDLCFLTAWRAWMGQAVLTLSREQPCKAISYLSRSALGASSLRAGKCFLRMWAAWAPANKQGMNETADVLKGPKLRKKI